MPDAIFADPRLARVYDAFDGERDDLDAYVRIAGELGARTVLDVGSGTGCFALLAASAGLEVSAVDPARASVEVARTKPGAERVSWHVGTVDDLPFAPVDLVVMTGNVAQVFLEDRDWDATLAGIAARLAPGGALVFESRRWSDHAWERWRETQTTTREVPGLGPVIETRELLEVGLPFVRIRQTYLFPDGERVASDSSLRFRTSEENTRHLLEHGLHVVDVRDASDRPGREDVYVCRRSSART